MGFSDMVFKKKKEEPPAPPMKSVTERKAEERAQEKKPFEATPKIKEQLQQMGGSLSELRDGQNAKVTEQGNKPPSEGNSREVMRQKMNNQDKVAAAGTTDMSKGATPSQKAAQPPAPQKPKPPAQAPPPPPPPPPKPPSRGHSR